MKKLFSFILAILVCFAIFKLKIYLNTTRNEDYIIRHEKAEKKNLELPKKINEFVVMDDIHYYKPVFLFYKPRTWFHKTKVIYIDLNVTDDQFAKTIKDQVTMHDLPNILKTEENYLRTMCRQLEFSGILIRVDLAYVTFIHQGNEIFRFQMKHNDCLNLNIKDYKK